MKYAVVTFLGTLFCLSIFAQEYEATYEDSTEEISYEEAVKQIEASLEYKTGRIELPTGNADLNVPSGFKFLEQEDANYVLSDLWGNPEDDTVLGLLVPEEGGVMNDDSWVFAVSFEEMGYVKDEDADEIDYDDLLDELQTETTEENKWRVEQGYEPIQLIGWASKPYYDKSTKVLHWAKELKFGEDSLNTLNYNLRVLGRKGVYMINAIAGVDQLQDVKASIPNVLNSVQYKEGHRYADFDENIDDVAAWTIGGLVAGKILAKTGFFVVLAKFWKVIAIALAGAGGAFLKFFKRKKKDPVIPESSDSV